MDILLISGLNFRQEQNIARHLLSLARLDTFKDWNWFFTEGADTTHQAVVNKFHSPQHLKVEIEVPSIDKSKCQFCGACLKFCKSNALHLHKEVPDIKLDTAVCSGCGKCIKGCNRDFVISTQKHNIGEVKSYKISPKIYYLNASLIEGQHQIQNLLELSRKISSSSSMNFIEIAGNFNQATIYKYLQPGATIILRDNKNEIPSALNSSIKRIAHLDKLMNRNNATWAFLDIDFGKPKEIAFQLHSGIIKIILKSI
ncbi:MAG: 4Fe-4S dicluster domain-containing protein [Bacteroidota bacterium]